MSHCADFPAVFPSPWCSQNLYVVLLCDHDRTVLLSLKREAGGDKSEAGAEIEGCNLGRHEEEAARSARP